MKIAAFLNPISQDSKDLRDFFFTGGRVEAQIG